MINGISTEIEFITDAGIIRTQNLNHYIPSLAVGQEIVFDHPVESQCLTGTVERISNVVFLDKERSMVYVNVKVTHIGGKPVYG